MADLENIKKEYETVIEKLSDPELSSNWESFEKLSKQKGRLEKVINKENELKELQNRIQENKLIISGKEDSELMSLAESELMSLSNNEKKIKEELKKLVESLDEDSEEKPESILLEIREGTGGEEAGLFAADLFNMYSKYAQNNGWKTRLLDSSTTGLGGYKEIIFEVDGKDVFDKMIYEGGVHRVQRIPETEKNGRIHTSTATVAVLPKPKKSQLKINPADLRIDYYHSSGAGGQNVNKRETAVRITHLPTGLAVASQTQRHMLENKENAMAILEAKLIKKQQDEEDKNFSGKRKSQIGTAERSEKIRTYNFPQDRVTDHRIKKNWHNIAKIMEGDLSQIFEDLKSAQKELES